MNQVQVEGDLIISSDKSIRTRSKTKSQPDQFTIIPFPLKIIKLMTKELASAPFESTNLTTGGNAIEDRDGDEEWEDLPDIGNDANAKCMIAWCSHSDFRLSVLWRF